MLQVVIGTNENKILCISNNDEIIKRAMIDYLAEYQEEIPPEDFYESKNWGEYDIEMFDYSPSEKEYDRALEIVMDGLGRSPYKMHTFISNAIYYEEWAKKCRQVTDTPIVKVLQDSLDMYSEKNE